MITKYNEFINESLLDKMKGKSKEDLWKSFGFNKTFDTPEEFFLGVIKDMKKVEQHKLPNIVLWKKTVKFFLNKIIKIIC